MAGQFGAWTPIGAAVTATGYEVAWKVAGADQYVVWNTDSSGNYISNLTDISFGNQRYVGVARDRLPPGLERRRGDRRSHTHGDPDDGVDQPGRRPEVNIFLKQ